MERLTEKVNGEYIHKVHKYTINDCWNKLGKLEDIEQELGITLEVLFKALKDGIWLKNGFVNAKYITFYFKYKSLEIYLDYKGIPAYTTIYSKDYGKTWWLEKPKEEMSD